MGKIPSSEYNAHKSRLRIARSTNNSVPTQMRIKASERGSIPNSSPSFPAQMDFFVLDSLVFIDLHRCDIGRSRQACSAEREILHTQAERFRSQRPR
jgi:hypothetical protein